MLLVDLVFINETHQCKALVHLFEVQHHILLSRRMLQLDRATGLIIKSKIPATLIRTIDTRHINEYVYQLTADFIVFHFNLTFVCSDVNLGYNVEHECLLNL